MKTKNFIFCIWGILLLALGAADYFWTRMSPLALAVIAVIVALVLVLPPTFNFPNVFEYYLKNLDDLKRRVYAKYAWIFALVLSSYAVILTSLAILMSRSAYEIVTVPIHWGALGALVIVFYLLQDKIRRVS